MKILKKIIIALSITLCAVLFYCWYFFNNKHDAKEQIILLQTDTLHEAVVQRDIPKIQALLAAEADVNALNHEGKTALSQTLYEYYKAVWYRRVPTELHPAMSDAEFADLSHKTREMIKILVVSGADVNTKGRGGSTALLWAVENENIQIMELLLSAGVDVNVKDNYGRTLLFNISEKIGSVNPVIFKLLLDAGADFNIKAGNNEDEAKTVLMLAVKRGQVDIVRLLIDAGADVNAQGEIQYTRGKMGTLSKIGRMRRLVEQETGVKQKPKSSQHLFFSLFEGNDPPSPVLIQNKIEIAKILLDAGINLDVTDINGSSMLHVAVEKNKIEITELLLSAGANVNAQDKDGRTARDIAVENKFDEIITLLDAAISKKK